MSKPWSEMTPAERIADRIAKNRAIDSRAAGKAIPAKKSRGSSAIDDRQKAVRSAIQKFEQIKATQGIDAASEFIHNRKP